MPAGRASRLLGLTRYSQWLAFKRSVIHFVREDEESMKPPSNVNTPAQYIASLPADRAKTIATVRALVNKHIPRGYDECLVWARSAGRSPCLDIQTLTTS